MNGYWELNQMLLHQWRNFVEFCRSVCSFELEVLLCHIKGTAGVVEADLSVFFGVYFFEGSF